MKALSIFCEYLLGFVVLLITLVTILIGLFVSLFELPRYFKYKRM
ncbi:MAG TPA: hypothetical protein VFE46_17545 [Pirellulales bacterium]|jgi:hypothetical protein|nr:hypothetical protein [Pirellulales bacterium]